jgi:hypothetical protein
MEANILATVRHLVTPYLHVSLLRNLESFDAAYLAGLRVGDVAYATLQRRARTDLLQNWLPLVGLPPSVQQQVFELERSLSVMPRAEYLTSSSASPKGGCGCGH